MPENGSQSLHFVNQIVEKTFEALANRDEFNDETMGRLRDLAEAKGLSKFESVVHALVGDEEA